MKVILIAQARSTSTRLPNKNLLKIGDKSIIEHHISRLSKMNNDIQGMLINEFIIATPHREPRLKDYQKLANKYGWVVENPNVDENNVLSRFVDISLRHEADWVVRTTADCWDMGAMRVREIIKFATEYKNPIFDSFREGSTVEVFPAWCLYRTQNELFCNQSKEALSHKEHVTSYFRKGFEKGSIDTKEDLAKARAEYDKRN